jgi:hypothetical protein
VPHIVKSTIVNAPTDTVWNVLRDFNGHDRWHPAVATSAIERAQAADKIGCVRRFKLKDGSELREQLLALSDLEQTETALSGNGNRGSRRGPTIGKGSRRWCQSRSIRPDSKPSAAT